VTAAIAAERCHDPTAMDPEVGDDPLERGAAALGAREWHDARSAFEEALANADTPEANDGLGLSLWWLRDVDGAIGHRERAYAAFRARGDLDDAVRIALWLATEYLEAVGNEPASRGWLARAEGLVGQLDGGSHAGWLALTRGRLRSNPADAVEDAEAAIAVARERNAPDLEASGIALLGLALVERGEVDPGLTRLDEAMAAATGGEVTDAAVFGDVCCLVTRAAENAGDVTRLMRWNEVVTTFMERSGHAGLLEFCGTCCAEVLIANGNLEEAEGWLARTLRELEGTGYRARCVHPAAKFAELRMLQGRVEDAERLLAGYEDRTDALRATARLHLLRGEPAVAAAILHRRINQLGDGLLAVPLLALLVEVQVARGDVASAHASADRLAAIARATAQARQLAVADLALGRAARAAGDAGARERLEAAVLAFAELQMPLEAAAARLELAALLADAEPEVAANEARLAAEAAERAGARALADRAAALVRDLGGPARTGPKLLGLLSRRETEVLRLLADGLTNAEIAARLFISTKTAGNHVSNVLSKLNLRSRSEAAAYAVRYLGGLAPVEVPAAE
jgi:DNA-binding NarL/FixJ family response regulator/tetratricopeptide (TPR) repeat protein